MLQQGEAGTPAPPRAGAYEQLDGVDERALRRRLGGRARGRGVPTDDFEDALQEAWCKLLATARRGRPIRNLEHGLRWNVGNAWKEEARRRHRRPTVNLDSAAASRLLACPDADPYEQLERLEAARLALEAVSGLTERQRQIVLLADIWGRRPSQVWTELGLSERTYQREHSLALRLIAAHVSEPVADKHEDPIDAERGLTAAA